MKNPAYVVAGHPMALMDGTLVRPAWTPTSATWYGPLTPGLNA